MKVHRITRTFDVGARPTGTEASGTLGYGLRSRTQTGSQTHGRRTSLFTAMETAERDNGPKPIFLGSAISS